MLINMLSVYSQMQVNCIKEDKE